MAPPDAQAASNAVFGFVQSGKYPESEELVSAELPTDSLKLLRSQLNAARSGIQTEIRSISKQAAPDVDEWIRRAKELQVDIEQSRIIARDVVSQAAEAQKLHAKRSDAREKVTLLQDEVAFNTNLQNSLGQIKAAASQFQDAQQLAASGRIEESLHRLQNLEISFEDLGALRSTNALELLRQRVEDLKATLIEQANEIWSSAILFDPPRHVVTILTNTRLSNGHSEVTIEDVTRICASLDLLESNSLKLARDLQRHVLLPLFAASGPSPSVGIRCTSESLVLEHVPTPASEPAILDHLVALIEFFSQRLPASVCQLLATALMPAISSRLESHELSKAVPTALRDVSDFEVLLKRIKSFSDQLAGLGWTPSASLATWADYAPKIWLSKRRESSINELRLLFSVKVRETKAVERVETQEVGIDEVSVPSAQFGGDEDWNQDWDDEQPNSPLEKAKPEQEEDDWGWDEQEGDEQARSKPASPVVSHKPASPSKRKAVNGGSQAAERKQVTLRESYMITGIPDELQRMISQLLQDAIQLSNSSSPVASAANALLGVPTLLVATYRALGPSHYELLPGGLMFLYNDSTRLAEELQRTSSGLLETNAAISSRLKLGTDIESLQSFAKRAYGRAMDAQRTIVRDLIDNAQGFTNCTSQPYASACDEAVAATISHVRGMASEWGGILSRSALLQSLGSILAAAIGKVILDIEEMSDIGDDESRKLRKYCQEICKLGDLFAEQTSGENEESNAQDMAILYTPNWIKFQYLIELLESSLADIKYLWIETEGLRYEYDVNELVDLVEALFADNDHRRRAIAEIRR